MSTITLLRHGSSQTVIESHMITRRLTNSLPRRNTQVTGLPRHASTSTASTAAQYHIPRRVVHVGVPLLATIFAIINFTDPSLAPQPPRKLMEDVQGKCTKIHASDLNKYIKTHPDEMSDEHTVAWNKMFNSYKEFRKSEGEPARIEQENARKLAEYARIEDRKYRSTKVKGVMATEGGNRNITHRPEMVDEVEEAQGQTFRGRIDARLAEAQRRFTRATKGSALFG